MSTLQIRNGKIKEAYASGESKQTLCEKFGLSLSSIRRIVAGVVVITGAAAAVPAHAALSFVDSGVVSYGQNTLKIQADTNSSSETSSFLGYLTGGTFKRFTDFNMNELLPAQRDQVKPYLDFWNSLNNPKVDSTVFNPTAFQEWQNKRSSAQPTTTGSQAGATVSPDPDDDSQGGNSPITGLHTQKQIDDLQNSGIAANTDAIKQDRGYIDQNTGDIAAQNSSLNTLKTTVTNLANKEQTDANNGHADSVAQAGDIKQNADKIDRLQLTLNNTQSDLAKEAAKRLDAEHRAETAQTKATEHLKNVAAQAKADAEHLSNNALKRSNQVTFKLLQQMDQTVQSKIDTATANLQPKQTTPQIDEDTYQKALEALTAAQANKDPSSHSNSAPGVSGLPLPTGTGSNTTATPDAKDQDSGNGSTISDRFSDDEQQTKSHTVVINSLSGQISTHTSEIAALIANEQTTTNKVTDAQTTANRAEVKADGALRGITQVKFTADQSEADSQTAITTAGQANQTATDAKSIASLADQKADQATTAAGKATTEAHSAKTTADHAEQTASTASHKADKAQTDATYAVNTSNAAKQSVTRFDARINDNTTAILSESHARYQGDAQTLAQANQYTDQKFANIDKRIGDVKKRADAGSSSALAAVGIPGLNNGQTWNLGAGVGSFGDAQSVAVGGNYRVTEHVALKMGATASPSTQDFGGFAGVAIGY